MKNTLYVALVAAAMAVGASGSANAAVTGSASHVANGARTAVAPLKLIDSVHWRRDHKHLVCVWRHHRRICWWR